MDAGSAAAPAVAVVGVLGTLLSALLTQRAADRGRLREQERAELLRRLRSEDEARRSGYVALNTAARQYLAALTDQLHALSRDEDAAPTRRRLTEARDLHREVHAEAQMRMPERVLDVAGDVSHRLGAVYGMLKRIDTGTPRVGDSVPAAQARIDELWDRLRAMRREMRADLGASGADSGR